MWKKVRDTLLILLRITSGYMRRRCGCSFLILWVIAQCEAFKISEMETELFFFHYSCWEHPCFWWVQGSVTNRMELRKYPVSLPDNIYRPHFSPAETSEWVLAQTKSRQSFHPFLWSQDLIPVVWWVIAERNWCELCQVCCCSHRHFSLAAWEPCRVLYAP